VLPYAAPVAYSPAHSIVGLLVSQRVLSGPVTMGLVGKVIAELATHPDSRGCGCSW
jgi:hypothetical protein